MRVESQISKRGPLETVCRNITIASVCSLLLSFNIVSSAASAEEFVEHQTNAALSSFYGFCLNDRFEVAKVKSVAERLGWKVIPEDELALFVPDVEAKITSYSGYVLLSPDNPPLPIMAFVGTGLDESGITEQCSMFFGDVSPQEFRAAFVGETSATLVAEQTRFDQRVEFFTIPDFPEDIVLQESQPRARGLRATFLIRMGHK